MKTKERIAAIKQITKLLKLNQHPATQLEVSVVKEANKALNKLLQII